MVDEIQKRLLEEVAGLHEMPEGAYNIRANGEMADRNTTANIDYRIERRRHRDRCLDQVRDEK